MTRSYTAAETAKLMRAALKAAFPGQYFSLRSHSYAGGSDVHTVWFDGPTDQQVAEVLSRFRGAHFDAQVDLKTTVYHEVDGERVHYGADYCNSTRHISEDWARTTMEWLYRNMGVVPAPVTVYAHDGSTYACYEDRTEARWYQDRLRSVPGPVRDQAFTRAQTQRLLACAR